VHQLQVGSNICCKLPMHVLTAMHPAHHWQALLMCSPHTTVMTCCPGFNIVLSLSTHVSTAACTPPPSPHRVCDHKQDVQVVGGEPVVTCALHLAHTLSAGTAQAMQG
jgi:hypothetical protein